MYYKGQFTCRNNGQDLPAVLYILPDGALPAGEFSELAFGLRPALISWDEAPIHGGLHSSRLESQIIALSDGQYRELLYASELHCVLSVNGVAVWSGSLAQRTWDEPFSREKNYCISLTFSDFNSLERRDVEESWHDGQRHTMTEILTHAFELITGMEYEDFDHYFGPGLNISDMVLPCQGGQYFGALTAKTDSWFDSDGRGRSWKAVLEGLVSSMGVHLMQWAGEVHAYTLDYASAMNEQLVSHSLRARGTDAMLSVADYYDRISVQYDQAEKQTIESFVVPAEKVDYLGQWTKIERLTAQLGPGVEFIEPELNAFLFLGEKTGGAYYCSLINDGVATLGVILNGDAFVYNDPAGRGTPTWGAYTLPAFSLSCDKELTRSGYPKGCNTLTAALDFTILAKRASVTIPETVRVNYTLFLYADDGTTYQWGTVYENSTGDRLGTDWWDILEYQEPRYRFEAYLTAKVEEKAHIMPLRATQILAQPPYAGRLELRIQNPTVSGNDFVTILNAADIELTGFYTPDMLDKGNRQEADGLSILGGEDLHLRAEYGTPKFPTVLTCTAIDAGAPVSTDPSKSYARRLLELCRANYAVTVDGARSRIKGSYAYDHLSGLPFFDDSADPVASAIHSGRYMTMIAELWDVRKGIADLTLEEFSITPIPYAEGERYMIVAAPGSADSGEGSEVNIYGFYPGVQGSAAVLDDIPVTWAHYTDGDDEHVLLDNTTPVSVTLDENTTGRPRSFLIPVEILNGYGSRFVRIRQEA